MSKIGSITSSYLTIVKRGRFWAAIVIVCLLFGIHGLAGEGQATISQPTVTQTAIYPNHLHWINGFLDKDQQRVLSMITDPSEDAFSAWYDGPGRDSVVSQAPMLNTVLHAMDTPLKRLRLGLEEINQTLIHADPELPKLLNRMEVDNLAWAARIYTAISQHKNTIPLADRADQFGLGQLIHSDKGKAAAQSDAVLADLIQMLSPQHNQLHQTAVDIDKAMSHQDDTTAMNIYHTKLVPALRAEQGYLHWFRTRVTENLQAEAYAKRLVTTELRVGLDQIQAMLSHVTQVSGNLILLPQRVATHARAPLIPSEFILIGNRFSRYFPGRLPRQHKYPPHPDRVVVLRNIWKIAKT